MAAEGPRARRRPPLGLLLLLFSSVGAELEVSVVSPVTAAIGSDAFLECTYTVDSARVNLQYLGVLWRFNEKDVVAYGGEMKVFDPRASINESEIRNGKASLLLSNVTTSDEGSYTCAVTYSPQNKKGTVTLNIHAQPEIIVPEHKVFKGKENLLRCFVAGFYPMDIDVFWRREGLMLPGSSTSKAQRSADGTFTISSTLPITPTDSDARANFSCCAAHVSLPRYIQKDVPLLFKVAEEAGVSAAAIVVPLVLMVALLAALGCFLCRRLTRRRLCKIQGPRNWTVGESVELVCVGHHWPTNTAITWVKEKDGVTTEIPARSCSEQQATLPLLGKNSYRAETSEAEEGGNNLTLTTTLHIPPSLEADEEAVFKCKFSISDLEAEMTQRVEEFRDFRLFAKPRVFGSIDCTPCGDRKVKCSLNLAQFYPENIEVNWSCGTERLGSVTSEEHRNRNDDHKTFDIRSECVIDEERFSDPSFRIRGKWKHESLKEEKYEEMSVTHPDFPGRPVVDDINVPPLISGVRASLSCGVSGYFPATCLQVTWLKSPNGSSAPIPLTSGNGGCATSMTPEQNEYPYSRTAHLEFTPDLRSDQESEFICKVSHPSLRQELETRTPRLSIMNVPRIGELKIFQEGNLQVLILNVTDFNPEKIAVSWSSDLPGKASHLPSKDVVKSSDRTYCIESRCELTEVMICRIAMADIIVSIEHKSQTEPLRVTMRLEHNDANWEVIRL